MAKVHSASPDAAVSGNLGSHRTDLRRPRSRFLAYLVFASLLFCGAVLLDGLLHRAPSLSDTIPPAGERVGAIHIHTRASDGGGTVAEVMDAGRAADLSFMAITDHNVAMSDADMAEDPPDFPIISGEELTTASGHFVSLGVPTNWKRPHSTNARILLAASREAGGFNILAHPFSGYIPWTDWKTSDFQGMEIWNDDETLRRNHLFDVLISMVLYPVNPRLAISRLARTPVQNFAKWDELLAERPVVGMCGADAHAAIRLGHGRLLKYPSYLSVFEAVRSHVLVGANAGGGDPGHASGEEILDAIRHGHSFCALDGLYPGDGFVQRVSNSTVSGGPGDFLAWNQSETLHISVPAGARNPVIEVYRDGTEILKKQSSTVDEPLPGPGRYRTEVFLPTPGWTGWGRQTLWIFSNPTYVTANQTPTSTLSR